MTVQTVYSLRLIDLKMFCRISCLCDFWGCSSGLKIIFKRWQDTMPSQRNFCSINSRFWPVKILAKKLTYPCVIFYWWTWFYFYKEEIYRWGFRCFFKIILRMHAWPIVMTGEWSFWPVKLPFWLDIVRWTAVISSPGSCGCCLTMHFFFSLCCAFQ